MKINLIISVVLILSACSPQLKPNIGNDNYKSEALDALGIYNSCMLYGAEKLAPLKEEPDILVQVAQGKCGKPFAEYELATKNYMQSLFTNARASYEAEKSIANSKQKMQELFLVKLIELRTK